VGSHRTGVVALIGKPNVGKSTLVNAVVGQKVTIVGSRRQTTRRRVLGVRTEPHYQLALVDTPGIHEPHTKLGRFMNEEARASLADVDLVLYMADASRPPNEEDQMIAAMLERTWKYPHAEENPGSNGVLLCLNKMDLLKAEFVVENVDAYCELLGTKDYMLTRLDRGENLEKLLDLVVSKLPEGEPVFPEEMITDQPMRRIAAELVREKAIAHTKQELPYAVAAVVDVWDEKEDGRVHIIMSLVAEKEGQKAILIGKQGAMLRTIGSEARAEIESLIGAPVFLEIHVKVREEWRQNPRLLHDLDLD